MTPVLHQKPTNIQYNEDRMNYKCMIADKRK